MENNFVVPMILITTEQPFTWLVLGRIIQGVALGQIKVADKSNEIPAIPELLEVLEVSGCIVTLDAMGCQTDIAQTIVDSDADYVFALKANQGQLYEDVQLLFNGVSTGELRDVEVDSTQTIDGDHGRIETRSAWAITNLGVISSLRGSRERIASAIEIPENFVNLNSVVKVTAQREIGPNADLRDTLLHFFTSRQCGKAA